MASKKACPEAAGLWIFIIIMINAVLLRAAFVDNSKWYWLLLVSIPLFFLSKTKIIKLK